MCSPTRCARRAPTSERSTGARRPSATRPTWRCWRWTGGAPRPTGRRWSGCSRPSATRAARAMRARGGGRAAPTGGGGGGVLAAGPRRAAARPAWGVLDLPERPLLHAGPPIEWADASGPLRGALIGACLFEGWASSVEEAEKILAAGEITLDPCHHHRTVGPMAGVTSPSMWMWCLADPVNGGRAFCNLNEGLGKVLRMGAYNDEVLDRLAWMRDVLGPVLSKAVRS